MDQLSRVKDLPVPEFGSLQAWEARASAAVRAANGNINVGDSKILQLGYNGVPMPYNGDTKRLAQTRELKHRNSPWKPAIQRLLTICQKHDLETLFPKLCLEKLYKHLLTGGVVPNQQLSLERLYKYQLNRWSRITICEDIFPLMEPLHIPRWITAFTSPGEVLERSSKDELTGPAQQRHCPNRVVTKKVLERPDYHMLAASLKALPDKSVNSFTRPSVLRCYGHQPMERVKGGQL
ncbi:hypothetical protein Fmac_024994 [Flemingia macrophylla]|uniref:Uncharacterized protein n=1 Tax=Flemingia macrophylla TaxID=520843 RepID=A0ABD1LQY1_9FABA